MAGQIVLLHTRRFQMRVCLEIRASSLLSLRISPSNTSSSANFSKQLGQENGEHCGQAYESSCSCNWRFEGYRRGNRQGTRWRRRVGCGELLVQQGGR